MVERTAIESMMILISVARVYKWDVKVTITEVPVVERTAIEPKMISISVFQVYI